MAGGIQRPDPVEWLEMAATRDMVAVVAVAARGSFRITHNRRPAATEESPDWSRPFRVPPERVAASVRTVSTETVISSPVDLATAAEVADQAVPLEVVAVLAETEDSAEVAVEEAVVEQKTLALLVSRLQVRVEVMVGEGETVSFRSSHIDNHHA